MQTHSYAANLFLSKPIGIAPLLAAICGFLPLGAADRRSIILNAERAAQIARSRPAGRVGDEWRV